MFVVAVSDEMGDDDDDDDEDGDEEEDDDDEEDGCGDVSLAEVCLFCVNSTFLFIITNPKRCTMTI